MAETHWTLSTCECCPKQNIINGLSAIASTCVAPPFLFSLSVGAQQKVYTASYMWLYILAESVCVFHCVYEWMCMCASHCVLVGEETQLMEHLTEDLRLFQRKRKQRQTPNDTRLLSEACQNTFFSRLIDLISSGKPNYEPIFIVILSWQSFTARLSAVSQHVLTRFEPGFFSDNDTDSPFSFFFLLSSLFLKVPFFYSLPPSCLQNSSLPFAFLPSPSR